MSDDRDLLAAEYVLGTLDGPTRIAVRRHMATDASLRDAIAAWERRLAPLAEGVPPVEPPAGLWDRIAASLDNGAAGTISVQSETRAWVPFLPGVEIKVLHRDEARGRQVYLLRMEPGARLPPHPHKLDEECIILSGEMDVGGLLLRAGDIHMVHAGVSHPEVITPTGVVLYLSGELR
jgi:anti-sigma factor ChrR (cupin superfamily)